jgi:hypothetical protein
MKITTIGHACILIETNGLRILSDPWWSGPCFGAQWWAWPRPYVEAVNPPALDYIYISHGHHDHFHPGTLNTLSKRSRVLVSRGIALAAQIRELGFETIEIGDDERCDLGSGVEARIMQPYSDDTLFVVSDGREVCINLNDSLHAAPRSVQDKYCKLLKREFPDPDYLFCGYAVASHFPNCYRIPGKDMVRTAIQRQHYFNEQWCYLVETLKPKNAFPFAADVALLEEDLIWANEPIHNAERPTELFGARRRPAETHVFDQAPGFIMGDGKVARAVYRERLNEKDLRETYVEEIKRANTYGSQNAKELDVVLELLRNNVDRLNVYLASCPHDYRFLLRFRGYDVGFSLDKRSSRIGVDLTDELELSQYDLAYTTRLAYLKWSLSKPYGDEVLFVGSGGIFDYQSAERVRDDLHLELRAIVRGLGPVPMRIRQGAIKSMLATFRSKPPDIYDLNAWTVLQA